ncbi:MAG: amidohydrolase family protein [Gemmatimonadaceae bacterium]|nr:amidohydrolase family protein [Gemmatimonadaceae bacterium]
MIKDERASANGAPASAPNTGALPDMRGPLIDPHAHFHSPFTNRADWERYNRSRLNAGARLGVCAHVVSVLGSWGHTSPTYFSSPDDQTRANAWLYATAAALGPVVQTFVAVNPNFTQHALTEIRHGIERGAVGIKLAAGRRADDVLLDDIAQAAAHYGVPILHHVWQHRRRDWPNQDASDGIDVARLAARHPSVTLLLAHLGGGGDWSHTLPAVRECPNIVMDLSGSGIDRGMIDEALRHVGASRLLWAADLTLCTGLTKLRALLHTGASAQEVALMRWGNAARIFPPRAFAAVLPPAGLEGMA